MTEVNPQLLHLARVAEIAKVPIHEFVEPISRHILVGRIRLHYLDWGGDGRTLLFLHGGGLTAHSWDLMSLHYRGRYRCLALDLRGHGESEWSPNLEYGLEKHAGDVAGLVEALDIHKFCLVGMSLGGLSAISYAGHHSTNLAGLVLVDVGPRTREAGTDRIKNFMAQPAELDSVEDFVERAMSFNPARDPVLLRQSLLHNLHQLPNGKWTWKYDRRHRVRPDLDTLEEQREGLWADVSSITCPTLIARGARSDVFTDEDASELAGMFPQARWVRVDRAGHTVQGDNPLGLIEVMTPFLEKLPWSS